MSQFDAQTWVLLQGLADTNLTRAPDETAKPVTLLVNINEHLEALMGDLSRLAEFARSGTAVINPLTITGTAGKARVLTVSVFDTSQLREFGCLTDSATNLKTISASEYQLEPFVVRAYEARFELDFYDELAITFEMALTFRDYRNSVKSNKQPFGELSSLMQRYGYSVG